MKKNFSRDLAIGVIAVSEDVMSFADAQKFAAEKGGRLPDQVEAMLIVSESTNSDLMTANMRTVRLSSRYYMIEYYIFV